MRENQQGDRRITAYISELSSGDELEPGQQLLGKPELAPGVEWQRDPPLPRYHSGRIAAQLARQVIFQKVRLAERDTVFQGALTAKGVLNATVKRIGGQDIIFDTSKAEARCARSAKVAANNSASARVRTSTKVARRQEATGDRLRAAPELVRTCFSRSS
jgi:N utilization substance protein A